MSGPYGRADASLGGVFNNFDPAAFDTVSSSFDAARATLDARGDGRGGGYGGDGGFGSDGGGGGGGCC